MRHWLFFTIAIIAGLGVFLRVWAVAPDYERRLRHREELSTLATNYSAARREAWGLVRSSSDAVAAVESYFARRPEGLPAETHADAVLTGMTAQLLWAGGRESEAEALWRRAGEGMGPGVASELRGATLPRRLVAARTLAEVGRIDEARTVAESCQRWADERSLAEIHAEASIMALSDLGWVWARLNEPGVARGNWERLLAFHEDQPVVPYNMACYTALAGQRARALDYIEWAVGQWRVDSHRVPFTLELMDRDPDLDSIRGDPRFAAAREELARKAALREALLESLDGRGTAGNADPTDPGADEPVP